MNRILAGTATLVLLIAGASPLSAQAFGLPVINSGLPTGIGFAADAGFANDAAGGGWAAGLTGKVGFSRLGVTATVTRVAPDVGDEFFSAGATANMQVFGGPLIPLSVTLQGGAGYSTPEFRFPCLPPEGCDVSEWRFPVGVGFAFTIPNPAMAIKPWIAPRVDITRLSSDGVSETDTRFAMSAGVELNFITGLGLHAAYDWINAEGDKPGILAAGLHYTFRVPGL